MRKEHNFKAGDYARIKRSGRICRVDVADEGTGLVGVIEYPKYATSYNVADIEYIDRRTAFLTHLQSLLKEYNAGICDGEGYRVIIDLDADSDKSERLFFELIYKDYISADNEVKESTMMVSLEQVRDCLSNRIAPYSDPKSVIASVEQIMNQLKEDLK